MTNDRFESWLDNMVDSAEREKRHGAQSTIAGAATVNMLYLVVIVLLEILKLLRERV